jgi:caffeoyl-CoA O-methyltransferase
MTTRSRFIEAKVADYAAAHVTPVDAVAAELRAATLAEVPDWAMMQIGDDQARLMELLVRAMRVERAIEIGTFTGYSALAVARGLAPGGTLLCCDISDEWTSIARRFWAKAGLDDRIELRIGPALDTLRALPLEATFDFAFIDADKTGYAAYLGELVPRTRVGGLILADNTLQNGRVVDPSADDDSVVAIRAFNDLVTADARLESVLLPIGDGITAIQKVGD